MPISQWFFWAVPIVALFSYCTLMLFLSISQKDKYIRIFMVVLAAFILWTASTLFMKMQLYPGPLFWNRVMVTAIFIVPFLLYWFVSVFVNSLNIFSITLWGILTVIAITANFLGLVVTDAQVISSAVAESGKLFAPVEFVYSLGPMATPIYVFMFVYVLAILIKIMTSIRQGNTTPERIRPISIGILIMFTGQIFNIFPSIGKYPLDILTCLINSFLIMISIYKYRLLELRFMMTKGVVYSIFAALLTSLYVYFFLFVERGIGGEYRTVTPYFTPLAALFVALAFLPLYSFSRKLVDKMFYKAEYSQRQALKNFSVSISNKLDLNDVAAELIEAVQLAIHPRYVFILLKHEEQKHYYLFASSSQVYKPDLQVSFDNPLVKWLINNNTSLSKQDMVANPIFKSMWEKEKRIICDLDIEVIVPIKIGNDLIGILAMTSKDRNRAYTMDDLDLLTYLGSSTAVAIDNARLYARAQAEALTDSLTKLYNHRYFRKALSEQMAQIGSSELSLLMIDLDLFKLYNDLYGHFEGDRALEKVASIMLRLVGEKGIVCRYGGEEFAILLPYYDAKRAFDLAEKIRVEIQRIFFNTTDVTQRFLTASVGVCTYPHAAANAKELLKRADLALYTAKNKGKNQTVIYTPNVISAGKSYHDSSDTIIMDPSYTATIYALTATIDAKDHYTFGHSQRVAEYVTILAGFLGLDKSDLEIIREAALLHDIGKIGIPESILAKTGRLTDEEFEIIKKHVEMSITIIKYLPSLNYVIPAVIGHHERWDGRGYPRGLKGNNIPLSARCLALTDAFDAMTSTRPYKAGLSVEAALKEIENNSGTQFDPLIANLFIKLVRDGSINFEQTIPAHTLP